MSTVTVQTISNGTVSTSSANVIQGSAKAWVNFDGTTSTIRASYNVSSVTLVSTGDYVVNFTNAFSDINFATVCSCGRNGGTGAYLALVSDRIPQTTTGVQIYTLDLPGTLRNTPYVAVSCFR
jgi:hypothetical protein